MIAGTFFVGFGGGVVFPILPDLGGILVAGMYAGTGSVNPGLDERSGG